MFKRWVVYLASALGAAAGRRRARNPVWALISARLPSLDVLTDYQPKLPLCVLSEEGTVLAEFGRSGAASSNWPRCRSMSARQSSLRRRQFYEHSGVDWLAHCALPIPTPSAGRGLAPALSPCRWPAISSSRENVPGSRVTCEKQMR